MSKSGLITQIPWAIFTKYYTFHREKPNKTFECVCKLCEPKTVYVSCGLSSSRVLKTHLIKQHGFSRIDLRHGNFKPAPRADAKVTQQELDQATEDLFINEGLPMGLIDSVHFWRIAQLGLPTDFVVGDRQSLAKRMQCRFEKTLLKIKGNLASVTNVATTVDCWTKNRRCYLCMTVHWIDEVTMKRKSAALALRRITGSEAVSDCLSAAICKVHSDFDIAGKVRRSTTDSAASLQVELLMADFAVVSSRDDIIMDPAEDVDHSPVQYVYGDKQIEVNLDGVTFLDAEGMLLEAALSGNELSLPPIHRCGSHILNLVAMHDARLDAATQAIHDSVVQKLTAWHTQQEQSTYVAEIIKACLGTHLIGFSPNTWMANYKFMSQINAYFERSFDNVHRTMKLAGLQELDVNETTYLREFVWVTEPLAIAMVQLRQENFAFLGHLLPTIYQLKRNLEARKGKPLTYCMPLLEVIISSLESDRRFGMMFNDQYLIMAACLIPAYKLTWEGVTDMDSKKEACKLILREMEEIENRTHPGVIICPELAELPSREDSDEDIIFLDDPQPSASTRSVVYDENLQTELNRYLALPGNSIAEFYGKKNEKPFRRLKPLFLFYNTALPSGASAEGLMSVIGVALKPDRATVTDCELEQQSVMAANRVLSIVVN